MTEYTNGIIPLERGEAAIIAGVGGSGKTALLEAIYQSEVDRKKRNVVMMHSPSRLFEASPSLAIIDFEYSCEAFTRIYGYCFASCIFMHLFINIGMTIGLMPVIGIPLPFISYGGSSLLSFSLMFFIFMALDKNERKYF